MQEIIDACHVPPSQAAIYIPLYLPDSDVTLSGFQLVQIAAPVVAGVFTFLALGFMAWVWWRFIEMGTCQLFFARDHEIAQVERMRWRRRQLRVS